MKTKHKFRVHLVAWMALLFSGVLLLSQCKKDDVVTPGTLGTSTGSDIINTLDGTWSMDQNHSSVNWKTAYYGDGAWLTGKFNEFGIDLNFNEANPSAGSIDAWVQLSSANTGESGRDALGKCLNGYLGVVHNGDTLSDGSLDPAGIDGTTDTARFTSTSVSAYGTGYKAIGTFTFKGVGQSTTLYFEYEGSYDYSDPQDGSKWKAGFIGSFEFLCKSNFGVTSTSIDDKILIEFGGNFKKN